MAVAECNVFVPTDGFFGFVAGSAPAIAVENSGLAATGVLLDVVYFLDDSVAEWRAAVSVADRDELLELFRENPGFRIHGDQVLVTGRRVEAGEFGAHFELFDEFLVRFGIDLLGGQVIWDLMPANPFTHALGRN